MAKAKQTAPLAPDPPPLPPGSPQFDQYYPGGVMKQMADLAGIEIAFNQDVPGGVIEQLRAATTPDIELNQHGAGGPHGQIGYTIVSGAPPDPGEGGGEGEVGGGLPGPQPRSAGVTAHDTISMLFDLPLNTATLPYPEDFLVMGDATVIDVDTVAVTGSQVDLACAEDLPLGVTAMAVSYTPGVVPLQGKDGVPVTAFSNFPVDTP
jgi:hypothetical protein